MGVSYGAVGVSYRAVMGQLVGSYGAVESVMGQLWGGGGSYGAGGQLGVSYGAVGSLMGQLWGRGISHL